MQNAFGGCRSRTALSAWAESEIRASARSLWKISVPPLRNGGKENSFPTFMLYSSPVPSPRHLRWSVYFSLLHSGLSVSGWKPSIEHLYLRFVVPLKHLQRIVEKTPNLKELIITGLSPSGNETFHQAVGDVSRYNPDLEIFHFAGQWEGYSVWNHRLSVPRDLMTCQNLRGLNICKIDFSTISRFSLKRWVVRGHI